MRKSYYVCVFDKNTDVIDEKSFKTRIGRFFYVRKLKSKGVKFDVKRKF